MASGLRIGSNIASLNAQRMLGNGSARLETSFERLSSGLRINRASDDAAGLAIADALRVQNRVFTKAVSNISDGISAISIAEGALGRLAEVVTRQIELAEQAANGSYTLTQRRALQVEMNALTQEFNRTVDTTQFNGINLLNTRSAKETRIQTGFGSEETIRMVLGYESQINAGTGSFTSSFTLFSGNNPLSTTVGDVNQDGYADFILTTSNSTESQVFLSNGNGTFRSAITIANNGVDNNNPAGSALLDVNMDGIDDFVLLNSDQPSPGADSYSVFIGNGDGTFRAGNSFLTPHNDLTGLGVGDFNGDGRMDLAITANGADTAIMLSNGDGTFRFSAVAATSYSLAVGDINNDGILDLASSAGGSVVITLGNGDGSFRVASQYSGFTSAFSVSLADFNNDGRLDIVRTSQNTGAESMNILLGNGNGTFRAPLSFTASAPTTDSFEHFVGDFDRDGNMDVALRRGAVMFGNGDGSFRTNTTYTSSTGTLSQEFGDFNNDGVLDYIGVFGVSYAVGFGDSVKTVAVQDYQASQLNILTQQAARTSLESSKGLLYIISDGMGQLGATRSRFEVAIRAVQNQADNTIAAESRIRDVDIAEESSALIKQQVVQQAAAAVLSQANQQPQLTLSLLRNA